MDTHGLLRNTIVIVTSDHGEMLGEHGLYLHRNGVYREGIRVPLIIFWKDHVPAGRRAPRSVTLAALPATIFDLIAEDAAVFRERSLVPLWQADPPREWPWPIAELAQLRFEARGNPAREGAFVSVVTPRWHYIFQENRGHSLFEVVSDPREMRDMAGEEPSLVRALAEYANGLRGPRGAAIPVVAPEPVGGRP